MSDTEVKHTGHARRSPGAVTKGSLPVPEKLHGPEQKFTRLRRPTRPTTKTVRPVDSLSNSPSNRPRIGFHAPIAGGLCEALFKSKRFGCDAVQIFSRNPRGWMARHLSAQEIEIFRSVRLQTRISPLVIHANYLINLAAADPVILEKSRISFREEIERGLLLGADYLVVHPGSSKGACESDGMRTCAESLRICCNGIKLRKMRILLENTAGQGECIGHRFEHLSAIMSSCSELKLGVCFDTAHAFTSGYDIREEEGLSATIEAIERTVRTRNVRAVHFNDSKAAFGSRVDRHWHIGEGHIGLEALRRVAQHPKLSHAAFLLETPQDEPGDDRRNLDILRSFVQDIPAAPV